MNRLLTILLLLGATAHGQINNPPTSVNIVDATATGRAVLTAANAAGAATAVGLGTANDVTFNRVQVGGATFTADEFSGGNFAITADHALTFASGGTPGATLTNLGLGAADNVTFSNITASGTLGVTGNATFSGTANLAPSQTADSGSSLMTRDLSDVRYGNFQYLKMATDISSVTNAGSATVSTESVTLVAGTYEITVQMFALCDSATAGIVLGLTDNSAAANGTGTFIGNLYVSNTHNDAAYNGVLLGPAYGGVVWNASQNFAFAVTDSASRRTMYYAGTGFLTLTATRTFKFSILQRHATDASNPAVLQANVSFAVFRRIY